MSARPLPARAHRASLATVSRAEWLVVALTSAGVCAFHLWLAFQFQRDGIFDQFDAFLDADPNWYRSAAADGWNFTRDLHPGFALFFNVPARVLDVLAARAGLTDPGVVRGSLAVALPAFSAVVAGVSLWLAAVVLGMRPAARITALLLLQGSFSSVVFGSIPESYPVSGMFFGLLILWIAYLTQSGTRDSVGTLAVWFVLAVALAGVTVTNGLACVAAWAAFRVGRRPWRWWTLEAGLAGLLVLLTIGGLILADRRAYDVPAGPAISAADRLTRHVAAHRFDAAETVTRVIELPAHVLSSVVAPRAERVFLPLAEKENSRYTHGMSIAEPATTPLRIVLAWCLLICGGVLAWMHRASPAVRAIAAIMAFHLVLHALWGSAEVVLYSQHWLAVVVIGVAACFDRWNDWRSYAALAGSAIVGLHSLSRLAVMIAAL